MAALSRCDGSAAAFCPKPWAMVTPRDVTRNGAIMDTAVAREDVGTSENWPVQIYKTLKSYGVSQISYVPDAGHSRLIELSHGDDAIHTTVLTTEEEGVALSAGAWLGGDRAVLLMQSSGVV